jgi:hypothetical protein
MVVMNARVVIPTTAAVMCVIAMIPGLPYGYFTLLRVIVCGAAAFSAFNLFERKVEGLAWAFVMTAVLFNPFIKIHLGRDVWWLVDGVAAALLGMSAARLRR